MTLDEGGWRRSVVKVIAPPTGLRGIVELFWIDEWSAAETSGRQFRVVADDAPHVLWHVVDVDGARRVQRLTVVGSRACHHDVDLSGSSPADWRAASPRRAAAAHSSARQPFHEPVGTVSRSRQPDGSTNHSTDARRLPGCGGRSACDAHLIATAPALNSGPTRRMDWRVGSPRANERGGAGAHAANAGANGSRVERREFRHGTQTTAQNSTAARGARALALGRARQLDACRGRRRLRRPAAPDSRLPRTARPSAGCVRRARG